VIGTYKPTAGHGGDTPVKASGKISDLQVLGGAPLLQIQHKPHLLRENTDHNSPCPVAAEDISFDLVSHQPVCEVADGVLGLFTQAPLRVHTEGERAHC
jgi:hypothetical protein